MTEYKEIVHTLNAVSIASCMHRFSILADMMVTLATVLLSELYKSTCIDTCENICCTRYTRQQNYAATNTTTNTSQTEIVQTSLQCATYYYIRVVVSGEPRYLQLLFSNQV